MVPGSSQKPFQMNNQQVETVKHIIDGVAVAGVPAGLFGLIHLSYIYTALGCIWIAGRIYESGWFKASWQRAISWVKRT